YLTVATPAPAALTPVAKATVKEQAALPKVEAQKPQTTPVTESPDSVVIAGVSSQELTVLMQQAVEQGLDKKLGPLHKQLAHALDPGPSFTSIIGGLGWIIGLAGLLAWMRSRRA
ncbi:MAG: hypothetical protein KKB70_00095, partial [Proteobacteria bacterium]|nr:hypothetical protein [Pseudomonadota bacterium]MBU1610610.1 hypothetical protein [Pseudomonadota bacterium]